MFIKNIRVEQFRHLRGLALGPFVQDEESTAIALAGPNGGGKSSLLEIVSYAVSNSFAYQYAASRTFGEHHFEVDIGLSAADIAVMTEWMATHEGEADVNEAIAERSYTRYFGVAASDPTHQVQHDRTHNAILRTLRNNLQRPLGFALRADRSYPTVGFDRQKLFQQQDRKQRALTYAFQTTEIQYRDMLDFLIEESYHYLHRLGAWTRARMDEPGQPAPDPPEDVMRPYHDLFARLLPGYQLVESRSEQVPSNLYVRLPNGDAIPFTDLSSGEKEIFFILASFIRNGVSHAVITVDEPELHLHPELTRRLVRLMQELMPGNQIWLATHNAEVMDEVGRDRTFFVARNDAGGATIVRASDESASAVQLRQLFGYSGYIGVGRALVFLEGEEQSVDRKFFTALFGPDASSIKLIPSGGVENVHRVNSSVLAVLDSGIGWMNYFAIRDRDFLSDGEVAAFNAHPSGRLRVLGRYHIENYLLDDRTLSEVLTDTFDMNLSPEDVTARLRAVAKRSAGRVLAAMCAYRLNRSFVPQDFSLGGFFIGVEVLDESDAWNGSAIADLERALAARVTSVRADLTAATDPPAVKQLVEDCARRVHDAFAEVTSGATWREMFPGRVMLSGLASDLGIKEEVALQNQVVRRLGARPERVDPKLLGIINAIREGATALP